MGEFDDLIPKSSNSGEFDDLVPKQNPPGFSLKTMASNIPESGTNLVKGIYHAVTNPLETIENVATIPAGAMAKVERKVVPDIKQAPGDIEAEKKFDAIKDFFKQRFGGVENIKQTIQNDPVGFLADLSTVISGVGGTISKVGELGEMSKVANVGNAISKAGEMAEPLGMVGKVAKPLITKVVNPVLGRSLGMTTGTYEEPLVALESGLKGMGSKESEAVKGAMRGTIEPADIVENAKNALGKLKDNRSKEYVGKLDEIRTNPNTFEAPLSNIKNKMNETLQMDYEVGIKPDGKLDFSRSTVADEAGQKLIEKAYEKVMDWGSQEGDFTPKRLDILKRQLDDLAPSGGAGQKFITELKNQVRGTLVENVPGYENMVKGYENASNLIREVTKTFSLQDKTSMDTSLRKLNQSLRQNFEGRKALLGKMEDVSGQPLTEQITGQQLSPWTPRGLMRPVAVGAGAVGAGAAGGVMAKMSMLDPRYLPMLAAASPRVVGETLRALGMGERAVFDTMGKIYNPNYAQGAYQAARVSNVAENKKK